MIKLIVVKHGQHWSVKQISILLTIVALGLWSYSITQSKLNIGFYGLIHSFPIIFFIALGILTIASAILWVSSKDGGKLLLVQLFFLIVSLWLTPLIVHGSQPVAEELYRYWEYAYYILQERRFNQSVLWQHNWPAFWIIITMVIRTLGMSYDIPSILVKLVPFLWQFPFLVIFYLFLKYAVGYKYKNYCWAGLWIFEIGFWVPIARLSQQSLGFFLYLLILFLLIIAIRKSITSKGIHLISILTFSSITISHLLSSLASFAAVVADWFSRQATRLFTDIHKISNFTGDPGLKSSFFQTMLHDRNKPSSLLPLIAGLFIILWLIYGGVTFFEARVIDFINTIFRLDLYFHSGVVARVAGNESHQIVSFIRILFTLLIFVLGISGLILTLRDKHSSHFVDKEITTIMVTVALLAISIGGGYYGELYQRILMFLLPILAYFGIKLLNSRSGGIILCCLMLFSLPLHFIAHYGNAAIDYFPLSHIKGLYFIEENTTHGLLVGTLPMGKIRYHPRGQYKWITLEKLKLNPQDARNEYTAGGYPYYAIITGHDRAWYEFLQNKPHFINEIKNSLNTATDWGLIYANAGFSLYFSR